MKNIGLGTSAGTVSEHSTKESHRARTVSTRHAPLHDDNFLALPRVENGHARDGRIGFQRNRVDGVIGADDESDVGIREVFVNLVHF